MSFAVSVAKRDGHDLPRQSGVPVFVIPAGGHSIIREESKRLRQTHNRTKIRGREAQILQVLDGELFRRLSLLSAASAVDGCFRGMLR
jgi:hypothetical protein